MINGRILELIKNPEFIGKSDVELLAAEVKKQPYLQSVRALHLFGVHRHRPEDYQNILSTTAAFTTDKKILYQFINKVPVSETVAELPAEDKKEDLADIKSSDQFTAIPSAPRPTANPVYVDGKLNRILFEGEEDFLTRDHGAIDLEQTKESGVIVTQNSKKPEPASEEQPFDHVTEEVPAQISAKPNAQTETVKETSEAEEIQAETEDIEIETEEPAAENIQLKDPAPEENPSLNFHGTEEFLPNVKPLAAARKPETYKVPVSAPNKNELEMQRLIAEVEAKMKTRKKQIPAQEEITHNTSLDFAEVQDFSVSEPKVVEETVEAEIGNAETNSTKAEVSACSEQILDETPVTDSEEKPTWKPMAVPATTPDSLIKKSQADSKIEKEGLSIDDQLITEQIKPLDTDDKSAFNISFFTQKVSSIETEKAEELIVDVKKHIEEDAAEEQSNVPVFINTWQNWLKIDKTRTEIADAAATSKEEEKSKVIDTFIVKEPRISKLREESDFVVKERGDNISHLMTETLAKLYLEQKLYAKAIKAYQTLIEKHPEKKAYFTEQIKVIKDLRQAK